VGFRPFVHRLATQLGLSGWVVNDSRGVTVEVEGAEQPLERFVERLARPPAPAAVDGLQRRPQATRGDVGFRILHSAQGGAPRAELLPDVASCDACLAEVLDPADRRHDYPFANCTHCGPRFSIVRALPYDRERTTMAGFEQCPDCRAEYDDPSDRRFHAQPNACPRCGPRLALWDAQGRPCAAGRAALDAATRLLAREGILAAKGLGGFHLLVDARSAGGVARLRERKRRWEKPFALMLRDASQARTLCRVDAVAAAALAAPEAPILLLPRLPDAPVDPAVAPGSARLGVMLASNPLQHLLLRAVDFPLVATSGNLSDEPICTDESEAVSRLGGIADAFLVHDRPIARHVDDSVAWVLRGQTRLLRRARGFAPRPLRLSHPLPPILAVGAHQKCSVALALDDRVFVSQHLGDLDTPEALEAFERVIADFLRLYQARPVLVAHDLHPEYASTRWAVETTRAHEGCSPLAGARCVAVQHHHAHLAACLAEHGSPGPALGVTWDGTGVGDDGGAWGGEFLLGSAAGYRRVAHLLPFPLPGGDAAAREPRRAALALLWSLWGPQALDRVEWEPVRSFAPAQRELLGRMLQTGVQSPSTTSAGRLFDGVAALLGVRQRTSFEGQAAMALEELADPTVTDAYPIDLCEARAAPGATGEAPRVLDWRPSLEALLGDRRRGVSPPVAAARFHNTLVAAIAAVARATGEPRVALTGGCFQNRWLCERAAARLEADGHQVLLHRQVPPNDGGISLGQVAVAAAQAGEAPPLERGGDLE
jgi:hydrogenase maturation protein HypF